MNRTVVQPLTVTDNKLVRQVRRLATHRGARDKEGRMVLEGLRLIEEARAQGARFAILLYSPRVFQHPDGRTMVAEIGARAARTLYVTDEVLAALSDVETSQGLIAVAEAPAVHPDWPWPDGAPPLFVAAEAIQDPGNLGTIARTAQAAGCHALGLTKGTVDPFSPKTLRASAGSLIALPMVRLADDWAEASRAAGLTVRYTVVRGGSPYDEVDWTKPTVLVLGNEGAGVTAVDDAFSVTIPMAPTANSLNVGAAAAVILFHAASARRRAGVAMVPPRVL